MIYTQTHHSQAFERQREREIFENSKREATHHVQGILNKINNGFLIRNHGSQNAEGSHS